MSATLLDISDYSIPLPEFIVLDASLVLELTPSPSQPHRNHAVAIAFLQRLEINAQQGRVKPILPLLAFEECYFKICQRVLIAYAQMVGEKWHDYYKKNPLVIRSIHPALMTLYRTLLSFPIEITEPEDIAIQPKGREPSLSSRIGDFIDKFAVLPRDATIFSEAERLGIYTVATLDSDWLRADGFTVYAPLP